MNPTGNPLRVIARMIPLPFYKATAFRRVDTVEQSQGEFSRLQYHVFLLAIVAEALGAVPAMRANEFLSDFAFCFFVKFVEREIFAIRNFEFLEAVVS